MSSERSFPNRAASVAKARRFVLDALGPVDPELAEAAAVMVSELAGNAIRHTSSSTFIVAIDRTSTQMRVAVTDGGPGRPVVQNPEPTSLSGRGLRIVRALAADWGVDFPQTGEGKTVWFTISLPPGLEAVARAGR